MKTALAAIVMATSLTVPAEAGHRHGRVYRDEICTKTIYEEIYRPPRSLGNPSPRGQIFSESYDIEVPCKRRHKHYHYYETPRVQPVPDKPDTNDCREGTAIGALLGGAGAAAISENDAYIWSIPLGIVGGAMAGCQIDGG
tara:strand:- start:1220 stop:1642 length:423 start_codon:yes stop_codon:yes gene_type:complete